MGGAVVLDGWSVLLGQCLQAGSVQYALGYPVLQYVAVMISAESV
jgi:hypothetical protein